MYILITKTEHQLLRDKRSQVYDATIYTYRFLCIQALFVSTVCVQVYVCGIYLCLSGWFFSGSSFLIHSWSVIVLLQCFLSSALTAFPLKYTFL